MATRTTHQKTPESASASEPRSFLSRIARDAVEEGGDPNHHLWRNGRLWWIAFTVCRGHLQERVRFSLKTADVEDARRRRDRIFAIYESAAQCRISIRLRTRSVGTPRESGSERR